MAIEMPDVEGAMVEWPQERRQRLSKQVAVPQGFADIPLELRQEVQTRSVFSAVVRSIVDAVGERADPTTKLFELVAHVDRPDAFGDYDETVRRAVVALAGVAALRTMPTPEMWRYLWSLTRHSSELETFLPQAVIAATDDTEFRNQFLAIARSVVGYATQNPGRHAAPGGSEVGGVLRDNWLRHPQLSALWRGQFDRSFHAVGRDDDHVLFIVGQIDVEQFVRLLALYDYPDPVAHALTWYGAAWKFERWRAVASAAPATFDQNGKWNGSLILPILLSSARDQFQFGPGRDPTLTQISEATEDIKALAVEIAKIIAPRADAVGCITRWGNWLIHAAIPAVSANPLPHPVDASSQGFVDCALLDALIAEIPPDRWRPDTAPGAESWEFWCQIAAGTLFAISGKALMPSVRSFLDEWHFTLDDWATQRGKNLKLHAIPFEGVRPRADGYGARLLAIPMVEAERADERWKRFWDSTATLREVVEFGDADEIENGGWQGRTDASRLLMFQFSIGLMMMDHLIAPPRPLEYDRQAALEGLLPLLHDAIREMTAIDQLNGTFWSEAVRHLAIRRAKWLSTPDGLGGILVNAELKPNLATFVRALGGDTENLLALAFVALQNGLDKAVLAAAFDEAEIDLKAEIAVAKHLLAMSPRAIGLNESQIDAVQEILRVEIPTRTIARLQSERDS